MMNQWIHCAINRWLNHQWMNSIASVDADQWIVDQWINFVLHHQWMIEFPSVEEECSGIVTGPYLVEAGEAKDRDGKKSEAISECMRIHKGRINNRMRLQLQLLSILFHFSSSLLLLRPAWSSDEGLWQKCQ